MTTHPHHTSSEPCLECIAVDISWLAASRAAALGLELLGSIDREYMKFADGRELRIDLDLEPEPYWRDVDLDRQAILHAAVAMVDAIAAKHGPGKIWTLLGTSIVHIVNDDGRVIKDGKIRLRRYLAHEATARPPEVACHS